jgi:hypothetical protein
VIGAETKSSEVISSPQSTKRQTPDLPTTSTPHKGEKSRKKGSGSRSQWVFKKDIDLRPVGKMSFAEFVAEKRPKSNEDKYAVAVYYLSEIAERPAVSVDDIGSVFRLTQDWREPKALDAGLRMASSRQGTLETSDRANIYLTPHGRNHVEHDLPLVGDNK